MPIANCLVYKEAEKCRNSQIQIRIRIHTSDLWIRIRVAQKHVDPDSDPDPQHCGIRDKHHCPVLLAIRAFGVNIVCGHHAPYTNKLLT
jgi:hypothetical protein